MCALLTRAVSQRVGPYTLYNQARPLQYRYHDQNHDRQHKGGVDNKWESAYNDNIRNVTFRPDRGPDG